MKYQTEPRKFDREFTITSPARELDKIEAECRRDKTEHFLERTDFHGSPEVFDFPTLREALARGIATKTAEAAAALKTIAEKSCGLKLRRTDEPARIVDISAYLQGVPECYYKPTARTKPHYKLAIFNSFPWWTPAHCIANRAAAIVALAKQMKAAGAGVSAEIVFRYVHKKNGASGQTLFPVNLDALNLGKFAFMMSPTFFRTYIFMILESQLSYWQRAESAASDVISPSGTPDHLRQINFPDGYQSFVFGGRTRAEVKKLNIANTEDLYGTPERAFETIKKQFAENVERIKHLQR